MYNEGIMENRLHQKIKVSRQAYLRMKELAATDEYRGRGLVGVVDKLVLGEFTTSGSGRAPRTKKNDVKGDKKGKQ